MAAPGATPIQIYYSTTASAVPSTSNLLTAEFAVNVTDKKIYTKDGGGNLITLVGTLGNQNANAVAITGGTIDNVTIGGSTATTGKFTSLTDTGLTSGRVTFAGTGGLLQDSANLTFDGTTLTSTKFAGALNGTVGATTPAAGTFTSLSDSGNLTFTGTGNRITGDFSNATVANRVSFQTSTTNGVTGVWAIPNGTSQISAFSLSNSSDPANASVGSITQFSTDFRISNSNTGTGSTLPITFFTGGSERMRIDTSGNVGIGTSSPSTYGKFVVQSAGSTGAFLSGSASGIGAISTGRTGIDATLATAGAANNFYTGTASGDSVLAFGSGKLWIGSGNYSSAGSSFAVIDSAGNVGIGTSSPAERLHVNGGDIRIQQFIPELKFVSEGAVNRWYVGANISDSTDGGLCFGNGTGVGNNERMRIDSSGNVGIGTSSPGAKLEVKGSNGNQFRLNNDGSQFTTMFFSNNGTDKCYQYWDQTNTLFVNNMTPAGGFTWVSNSSERMRIDSSGNVGIGTSSPGSFKLNVAGSLLSAFAQINPSNTTTQFVGMSITNQYTSAARGVSFIDSQGRGTITDSHLFFNHYSDFSSDIHFATQPAGTNTDRRTDRLYIQSNGNISPGVDNAQSMGVNGGRWSAIWAANGTIQTSDARKKTEIEDSILGLNFINQLRPVSYRWIEGGKKVESTTTYDKDGNPIFNKVETSIAGTRRHFGLLAQEVKEAIPEGVDFGGWILTDKDDVNSDQALRYDEFISPIIKAIQELKAELDIVKAELATLKGYK